MMDMEYNRTSPFISNCLHYSSEFHPYVGEFAYLCRTGNNNPVKFFSKYGVVICFHFTIFVVLETTNAHYTDGLTLLWFAFILLSLSYWKQRKNKAKIMAKCCDLLSFYYLCRTGNNREQKSRLSERVVICFHFTIFVVLETTWVCGQLNDD